MATGKMNSPNQVSVGIVSTGMYLPDRVLTASDIAEQSGLPEWVVRDKLGINEKRMAGPDDHPNQMGIWAAQGWRPDGHRCSGHRLGVGRNLRQVGAV